MNNTYNCTIVIPSYNRHDKLSRVFDYFSDFAMQVVCLDSSEVKYEGILPDNVDYRHLSGVLFRDKMFDCISNLNADYVVVCADDDFILKSSIIDGLSFLNEHMDYNCVVGKYLCFKEEFDGDFFEAYNVFEFYTPSDDKVENVKSYLESYYMILWGLYRRNDIADAYSVVKNSTFSNDNFIELIVASMLNYKGKTLKQSNVWGVRELAYNNWGKRHKSLCLEVDKNALNKDVKNISIVFDEITEPGLFDKAVKSYMLCCNGRLKNNNNNLFKKIIPKPVKVIVKKVLGVKVQRRIKYQQDCSSNISEVKECIMSHIK